MGVGQILSHTEHAMYYTPEYGLRACGGAIHELRGMIPRGAGTARICTFFVCADGFPFYFRRCGLAGLDMAGRFEIRAFSTWALFHSDLFHIPVSPGLLDKYGDSRTFECV